LTKFSILNSQFLISNGKPSHRRNHEDTKTQRRHEAIAFIHSSQGWHGVQGMQEQRVHWRVPGIPFRREKVPGYRTGSAIKESGSAARL
jgi:hypothetical protein